MNCFKEKIDNCEKILNEFPSKINIENIKKNYKNSKDRIIEIKAELDNSLKDLINNFSIILIGSFGRLESSELSDLDYCIVYEENINESNKKLIKKKVHKNLNNIFKNKISCFSDKYKSEILSDIGGFEDKSMDFTTRILIFLESIPLNENGLYNHLIEDLSNIYLEEYIREEKYPLFLTNEIIRFWRTLCIDYRWKKMEIQKPWGIRNIKLRFSRKFLCISSILILIMLFKELITHEDFNKFIHYPSSIKMIIIYNILEKNSDEFLTKHNKQVLLKYIEKILLGYNDFLSCISNEVIRKSLIGLKFEERNENKHYNELKEKAKDFHNNIINVFDILSKELIKKYLIF